MRACGELLSPGAGGWARDPAQRSGLHACLRAQLGIGSARKPPPPPRSGSGSASEPARAPRRRPSTPPTPPPPAQRPARAAGGPRGGSPAGPAGPAGPRRPRLRRLQRRLPPQAQRGGGAGGRRAGALAGASGRLGRPGWLAGSQVLTSGAACARQAPGLLRLAEERSAGRAAALMRFGPGAALLLVRAAGVLPRWLAAGGAAG